MTDYNASRTLSLQEGGQMIHTNLGTVGNEADPARCTGWDMRPNGIPLSEGFVKITVNDNGQVVYVTLSARTAHDMVRQLIPFAEKLAPIFNDNELEKRMQEQEFASGLVNEDE